MKIGFVGLGKLGLPIADEIARTHEVLGYDVAERHPERVRMQDTRRTLLDCDLVFVAVQTPHGPEYEGVTRIPDTRADFDYSYLTTAVKQLADAIDDRPPLVVISTVLPGTIDREIVPLWDGPVVYNPLFIAMGTEVQDFLNPEFVLIGTHESERMPDNPGVRTLIDLHLSLGLLTDCRAPILVRTYREAELAKVAYNTFVGLKVAYANTIGEIAHRLNIDADQVMNVVTSGHQRIISKRYLSPGMGDGGPCHPRDNIALSWLAREAGMSFDLFGAVMEQRERHADWLAGLAADEAAALGLDEVTVLGRAYKPGTRIETGSSALLVAELLRERGLTVDHVADLNP